MCSCSRPVRIRLRPPCYTPRASGKAGTPFPLPLGTLLTSTPFKPIPLDTKKPKRDEKSIMSNTDFLGRAIDTVKKAIENDNEGEYEKAYQQYYSSLELFMLALKWEKNPKSKEMIRSKAGEYMDRAEKLKNHLAQTDGRKKPSAVGANGKVAQGSGKGGYVVFEYTHFVGDLMGSPVLIWFDRLLDKRTTRRTTKMPIPRSYGQRWRGPS